MKALLVLEDGTSFTGRAFGAAARAHGEVVFSTAMTGYQEMLTDPSFAGQVLVLTYPLAGNYGINGEDVESKRIQVRGLVVHEACDLPSHWRSEMTLHEYLLSEGVPAIAGIDTRALTRRLRTAGVMMGAVTTDETVEEALARLRTAPRYGDSDLVEEVSTDEPYRWSNEGNKHIVIVDSGVKYNIMRLLAGRGCRVTALPPHATAEQVLALAPDGVLFSPGPGDPAFLDYQVATVRSLIGKTPILGICLGHQVLGRAFGAKTFKLKFGHRGANHPVKDLTTDRVHITAQNHGYAVDPNGLSGDIEVAQVHLNDGTCEGLRHRTEPVISIQYHSEASPGPLDNVYVFDRFLEMIATFQPARGTLLSRTKESFDDHRTQHHGSGCAPHQRPNLPGTCARRTSCPRTTVQPDSIPPTHASGSWPDREHPMTTEPTFRQATTSDAEAVLAIGHQLWDEMGERSGFTQRPTAEGIAPLLAGENGAVFVSETGGGICGFSLLAPDLSDPEGAVMGVWLLPEARRKGIGRELALMATDHARTLGYKRLRGLIPQQNEPALSFFSDIGSLAQMVGQGMQYELPL